MKTILVVGATGAQGGAIVQYLSSTNKYRILALTRNETSGHAQALAALPNVELIVSNVDSGYDIDAFLSTAAKSDYVLVNTDGFAMGEKAETFWGIRLFQLAARAGVKHFVYSGLDSVGQESNYDPELYVGHYEGKARVQEWIHAQQDSKMAWTIIRSGPYFDLLSAVNAPIKDDEGRMLFRMPLENGAIPFIDLGDFGKYVDWTFSNPEKSNHLDFGIAAAHVSGDEVAAAFTEFTGKTAQYVNISSDQWNEERWQFLPQGSDTKIGFASTTDQKALGMTYKENFANWWNLYKASKGNQGLIRRDYAFLDTIVPDRVRSLGEWMKRVGYTGEKMDVLKNQVKTG